MKKNNQIFQGDLINEYKKLVNLLDEVQKVRNNIDLILEKENQNTQEPPKLLGGGKIILINGEFKKVFGLLLNAIQRKMSAKNKVLYFFTQEEYDNLYKSDKKSLLNDPRNIQWEYKNYYTKKNITNKQKPSKNAIKNVKNYHFIRKKSRSKSNIYIKNYTDLYKPITEKRTKIALILSKMKFYPFSNERSSFLPIPKDIKKFFFTRKQRKKFLFKGATKNWTHFELAFMDLENFFIENIPGLDEKPGIPYITDSLAENILKGNLNLTKENIEEIKNTINNYSVKNKSNIIELMHNIDFEKLTREDIFVISKLTDTPIFEFGEILIKNINFKKPNVYKKQFS